MPGHETSGLEQGELPPNIAELFDQFVVRKDLLTEAERNILRYYIDGHEIAGNSGSGIYQHEYSPKTQSEHL